MSQSDKNGKTKKSPSIIGIVAATVLSVIGFLWQEFIGQAFESLLGGSSWFVLVFLLGSLFLLLAHLQRDGSYEVLAMVGGMLPKSPLTAWALGAIAAVCALALAAPLALAALRPACPMPTQIVVAASHDSEASLRSAAGAYETARADENGGCRPADVMVYAAGTTETVRQTLRNDWLLPVGAAGEEVGPPEHSYLLDRSLGAKPHYWIPESTVEYLEFAPVRDGRIDKSADTGSAHLDHLGATRMTPLVWAVPETFSRDPVSATPHDDTRLDWTRPGLRWTSVGRLHGAHQVRVLVEADRGDEAAAAEARFLDDRGADSSAALLCRVGTRTDTVALVSEAALYRARNTADGFSSDCPRSAGTDLTPRYGPDLPFLDHPLVRVTWEGEDNPELADERTRFEDFLLGLAEDGDAYTAEGVYAGYRSVTGEGAAADAMADRHDAVGWRSIPEWTVRFAPEEWVEWAARADSAYRDASEPATVLLAIDRSTSMASVPQQYEAARTVATTIIGNLRRQDRFGLWSYPAGDNGAAATAAETLVETAHHDELPDDVLATVEGLAPIHRPTPLREVIAAGALALEEDAAPGAMLVVVTDGVRVQDGEGMSQEELTRTLDGTRVRVRVIAVGAGARQGPRQTACEVGLLPEVVEHPNVECRDADRGRADESARGVVEEARGGR